LKKSYPILIIFGTHIHDTFGIHIHDTTGHSVSHLTQHLLLHYLGKTKQAKYYIFIQCNINI